MTMHLPSRLPLRSPLQWPAQWPIALQPREQPLHAAWLWAPLLAVALSLMVVALILWHSAVPLGAAAQGFVSGAWGSPFAWSETLMRATPLVLTGLAAALAFRARLYNIGAEGQLYLGALAAVAVGGQHAGLEALVGPPWVMSLAMGAAGALAGALWLLGPALFKARWGVDEVVTTLLLNFVALLGVSMMLDGPMKDPTAMGWPQSVALWPELEYTRLFERLRVHTGLVLAIALALGLWLMDRHTTLGLALRAVGANAQAAGFAGLPVQRLLLVTAALSGALAGLAGVGEVAGRTGYVTLDMSPGYGYSGIVIAMLAGLHPLGVVAAAGFVASILVGADSMSRSLGLPTYLADVVLALTLLSTLVCQWLLRHRLVWRPRASGIAVRGQV